MREIYLPAFEQTVKNTQPQWVMSAYNRINGVYASESAEYLTDILRDEWDFDGAVVSDWGTCDDPVNGLNAGMDLCIPGPAPDNVRSLKLAIENGTLTKQTVDRAVRRILTNIFKTMRFRPPARMILHTATKQPDRPS